MLLEAEGYTVIGEAEDGLCALARSRSCIPTWSARRPAPGHRRDRGRRRLTANGSAPAIVLTSSRDLEDLGPSPAVDGVRGFIPKSELSGSRAGGAPMTSHRAWAAPLGRSPARGSLFGVIVARGDPDQRSHGCARRDRRARAHRRLGLHRHRAVRVGAAAGQPPRLADGPTGFALLVAGRAPRTPRRLHRRRAFCTSSAVVRTIHLLAFPTGSCIGRRPAHRRHRLPARHVGILPLYLFVDPRVECANCPDNVFADPGQPVGRGRRRASRSTSSASF